GRSRRVSGRSGPEVLGSVGRLLCTSHTRHPGEAVAPYAERCVWRTRRARRPGSCRFLRPPESWRATASSPPLWMGTRARERAPCDRRHELVPPSGPPAPRGADSTAVRYPRAAHLLGGPPVEEVPPA